jgi:class 3 adenylate cyclase
MWRSQAFADPATEEAYLTDFARQWRGYYQVGVVLLPTLFGAFAVVDRAVVAGDTLVAMTAVRFVVVAALTLFVPTFFLPRLRGFYERHLPALLLAEGTVALGGLLTLGAIGITTGESRWVPAGAVGLLVAVSFVYGASRMRFRHATLLAGGVTLAALALLAASPLGDPVHLGFAGFYVVATNAIGAFVSRTLEGDAREAFLREREVGAARVRTERLLHSILHPEISERMRYTHGRTFAEVHPQVTVVLADLAGFTPLCELLTPVELGELLDLVFGRFDELCERHGVLKIKTLGDAWLACAGLPGPRADHAEAAAALAADMVRAVREIRRDTGRDIGLRMGVATGPVVAGVIGRTRYAYDVWGAAVREAMALEQGGGVDRVRLDAATAEKLPAAWHVEEGGARWLAVPSTPE